MANPKKLQPICYVVDYSLLIGGRERQFLEILKYLMAYSYEFLVVSLSDKGLLYQDLKNSYNDNLTLINRHNAGLFSVAADLRRYFIRHGVKICHVFDNLTAIYATAAGCCRKVRIINGSIRHAGVNKSWHYFLDFIMLRLADKVIANSFAGLKYYHMKRGEVIYNAIDRARFGVSKASRKSVIMTANFSDYKDHKTFFEAIVPLLRTGVLNKVGLLGDGPYLEHWKKYVSGVGLESFITFFGHRNDTETILPQYGTGVLCSTMKYREGISNSILEYMGSGLMVIASDTGATCEIITDKENGLLFQTGDSSNLRDKLEWAVNHQQECNRMVEKAYQTLEDRFSFEINMQKLVSMYKAVGGLSV